MRRLVRSVFLAAAVVLVVAACREQITQPSESLESGATPVDSAEMLARAIASQKDLPPGLALAPVTAPSDVSGGGGRLRNPTRRS